MLTINPELARQWDYERNALTPDEISAYSNKKVWWKCDRCNSQWAASVASRIKTTNCPFCINRRFRSGLNDIVTVAPNLEKEWDYDKNINIEPTRIICTSQKKVWWICSECGNSWKAAIRSRWSGSGCPACRSQQSMATRTANMLKNGNTLESLYPEIASEWHPTRNGDLRPDMVTARNGRKVWWLGKCGHEWQATVKHRTHGTGCPFCADIERGLARRQKVINLDTGEIFDSAISAAEKYHVSYSSIRICVLGKTKRAGKPKCRWAAYEE